MRRHIGFAAVLTIGVALSTTLSVNAAALGGKCAKAGITQVTKGVSYICVKSGKKTVWKVKTSSANSKAATSTSTTTTTTTFTATTTPPPLYADPEITSMGKLLSVQECRISDITSTQSFYFSSGFPRPGSLRSSFGQLKVLVIPVNFTDLIFSESDAQAVEALYSVVNTFYSSMSYGGASINMTLAARNSWVDLGSTFAENGVMKGSPLWDGSAFYRKVIDMYSSIQPISGFDVVEVVSANSTQFARGEAMSSGATRKNFSGFLTLGYDSPRWGATAHEIGHAWLGFEDLALYAGGFPFAHWDLMSQSNTVLSGWSRFLAGWIDSNWVRCASPHSQSRHYLSALNSDKSEDRPRLLVVPISTSIALIADYRVADALQFFVLNPTLVVYRVDTSRDGGNGPIKLVGIIDQKNGTVSTDGVIISVIGIDKSGVTIEVKN